MTPEEFTLWRARMGVTQSEAANMLGVTLAAIQHWQRGRRRVPKPIAKLCDYLEKERNGK
jgi:DNA-binding transcriptional regulator YiaG